MAKFEQGKIGRTVTFSHCKCAHVIDGELETFENDVVGNYTTEQLQARLRRKYKDPSIVVLSVERDSDYYSLPLEEFVKACIDYSESEKEN